MIEMGIYKYEKWVKSHQTRMPMTKESFFNSQADARTSLGHNPDNAVIYPSF